MCLRPGLRSQLGPSIISQLRACGPLLVNALWIDTVRDTSSCMFTTSLELCCVPPRAQLILYVGRIGRVDELAKHTVLLCCVPILILFKKNTGRLPRSHFPVSLIPKKARGNVRFRFHFPESSSRKSLFFSGSRELDKNVMLVNIQMSMLMYMLAVSQRGSEERSEQRKEKG